MASATHEVLTSAELAQRVTGQSPLEPFVSAKVVAEYLAIERRQVSAMTRAGKLPAHAVDPSATRKQWRYKLSEVDRAVSQSHSELYNEARQPRHRKGK
jgi:excisionase family DNA binding protein